ncbi:class I SAM-dependent methyltransferase [Streptomyces niveus]|uniref:class I SAM-dependent methyltransferase n=1 Tax=Streptomyces niveus TaxID=193462 RepID=UPI00371BAEBE
MLEQARRRPEWGIEWIVGDLESVSWEREFDFVVMTGHAFQVLLGDDELRAALGAVRAALTDGGQFGFETRDPLARAWESLDDGDTRRGGRGAAASMRMTRQVRSVDGEIVVFTSTLDVPGSPARGTATAPCAFSAPTGSTCSSPGRGRPSTSGTATGPVVRRARGSGDHYRRPAYARVTPPQHRRGFRLTNTGLRAADDFRPTC